MTRFPRFIKFQMSNRESFTIPRDQAEKLLNSAGQLVRITDPVTGEWNGEIINKAHIVDTKPDFVAQDAEIEEPYRRLERQRDRARDDRNKPLAEQIEERMKRLTMGRFGVEDMALPEG